MKIKCSNTWHILMVVAIISVAACGCLTYFKFGSIIPTLLVVILPLLLILRFWIVVGRTIIMDKEGCTIKFLGISVRYKWEKLRTKRIENYSRSIGTRQPYIEGAIFSPMYIKNPFRLMPVEYSIFHLSPGTSLFDYFFVYFDPHLEGYDKDLHPDIFVVEESEFRKYMAEWNVDIEDTTKTMSSSKR